MMLLCAEKAQTIFAVVCWVVVKMGDLLFQLPRFTRVVELKARENSCQDREQI